MSTAPENDSPERQTQAGSAVKLDNLPLKPHVLKGIEKVGYVDMNEEVEYWVDPEDIIGTIPAGLQGTMYRNGPGRQQIAMMSKCASRWIRCRV